MKHFKHQRKVNYFTLYILLWIMVSMLFADGFIVVPPPPGPIPRRIRPPRPPLQRAFPLEVKYHKVDVIINDLAAETSIDQEFYNPTGQRLEGYYMFPIPKGAVLDKFSMFINGKETEAEMLETKKARKIYEDIVSRMIDPALLEYYQQGMFKARIFPIEPHSTKRVKISYNQVLERDNGTVAYLYPLNTEKFSAKPLKDVVINVSLSTKDELRNVYCTSHETEVVRSGNNQATISFEQHNVKPDKDFTLFFRTSEATIGMSLLTYHEAGKDGFFFMNITPDWQVKEDEIVNQDITFVLDVSGSMAGEKLVKAKNALLFCVNNLAQDDRFELIRFSTESEALFEKLVDNSKGNIEKAKIFIQNLRAIGGTNINEALTMALKNQGSPSRPHTIIFITDGRPTISETNEDKLVALVTKKITPHTKIFTCGIGDEINTHLLDKITSATKSFRTYIHTQEDIEVKISNLFTKVQSPVLTNVKVQAGEGLIFSKIYPRELPDLFKGSSVTVLGRFRGQGKTTIKVTGLLRGKKHSLSFPSTFQTQNMQNKFIPSLWAARRIGYLLDQIRLHGENKELVDEVVDLARTYGIITPYTSYLIVEDEEMEFAQNRLIKKEQTLSSFAPKASSRHRIAKEAYGKLKEKSGRGSVTASEQVQELHLADNMDQALPQKPATKTPESERLFNQPIPKVKNIQGRAVYQTGSFWVDSYLQLKKYKKIKNIKYASKEYFLLLKTHPETAEFLSLGQNVRFVYKDVSYEISK